LDVSVRYSIFMCM